jgi:hypothetical protein
MAQTQMNSSLALDKKVYVRIYNFSEGLWEGEIGAKSRNIFFNIQIMRVIFKKNL